MDFIKKNWIVIAVVLLLGIGGFMWYNKSKAAPASGVPGLGKTKSGKDYTESDVTAKVKAINGSPDWKKDVQEKATKAGRSYDVQVRLEAIWMLENVD